MHSIGGSVWPFSQCRTVWGVTPSRSPAPFWLSLSMSRRRRRCWPKVRGSKSVSFGFNALRVTGTNCKRATRPCNCGYLGHYNGRCRCTPDQFARYRARLSGPLLDRIDIRIDVPALPPEDLQLAARSESSAKVRGRVVEARDRALQRQGKANAELTARDIDKFCLPDGDGALLLRQAIGRLTLSARGYHRILAVARTIADLAGTQRITAAQVAEAIQYRRVGLESH